MVTSGLLGEILTEVGVASVLFLTFLSRTGSVLGEILILVGEIVILLRGGSSFSSSLFFIMASLELVLPGPGLFLGDGPLVPFFDGLLLLPTAESEPLGLGAAAACSSEPLRAWRRRDGTRSNTH